MSKKYLDIGEHGISGDFYICDNDIIRADNLAIATKIAFNNWLREFSPLHRECTLVSITDGAFIVSITDYADRINTRTEAHTVAYHGPCDMFTAKYQHEHTTDAWYAEMYAEMECMMNANDHRVRRSNRTGLVMFAVNFPRYQSNGEWWSNENNYLSNEKSLADQQMEYAHASAEKRKQICKQNYDAMINSPRFKPI